MNQDFKFRWLREFATAAEKSDRFADKDEHIALLAAGLLGEAGSIVAELKKVRRDGEAYPMYRERMTEEVGDFLWYFVRLAETVVPGLVNELSMSEEVVLRTADSSQLMVHIDFGASVGNVLAATGSPGLVDIASQLRRSWTFLAQICGDANVDLKHASDRNMAKTKSRWPEEKQYMPLFDDNFPVEEQLPRQLQIDFIERRRGSNKFVILRCNGINFGDRLTDNIEDPDGYRFHDIFHFAHAVHLGWSPVVRALLRTKRKSNPRTDEAQDGARAGIIEEAVSAIVFSRAKQLKFFEGLDHVDLDLLKTVNEFVHGFEVATVPLWQWETAILDGYRVFRALCAGPGGCVRLNLVERRLTYIPHLC